MSSAPITIPVDLAGNPYRILVGDGIIGSAGSLASEVIRPCRSALITDENIAPLHAEKVLSSLHQAGFDTHIVTVRAGEASKSMETAATLCDRLIGLGLDRKSAVFALGGGVIGDLAGFVASIHYRGIPVIQMPSTVVAQVDSAIGGKTGVNSPRGKNLLGTFHQPRLVITDPGLLSTLPDRVFREGLAEVIKHAVIADAAMLETLPPDRTAPLAPLIAANASIKALIVTEDEFETKGTRALLNFGHTLGHAIEAVAGYGTLSHGECVAIGMMAALDLSVKLAGLPSDQADRVAGIIKACGLPTRVPKGLGEQDILEALSRDKKFDRGAIRFVLTKELGSAFVSNDVTLEDVTDSLRKLL
jgi:3-dehydroquinate synthase